MTMLTPYRSRIARPLTLALMISGVLVSAALTSPAPATADEETCVALTRDPFDENATSGTAVALKDISLSALEVCNFELRQENPSQAQLYGAARAALAFGNLRKAEHLIRYIDPAKYPTLAAIQLSLYMHYPAQLSQRGAAIEEILAKAKAAGFHHAFYVVGAKYLSAAQRPTVPPRFGAQFIERAVAHLQHAAAETNSAEARFKLGKAKLVWRLLNQGTAERAPDTTADFVADFEAAAAAGSEIADFYFKAYRLFTAPEADRGTLRPAALAAFKTAFDAGAEEATVAVFHKLHGEVYSQTAFLPGDWSGLDRSRYKEQSNHNLAALAGFDGVLQDWMKLMAEMDWTALGIDRGAAMTATANAGHMSILYALANAYVEEPSEANQRHLADLLFRAGQQYARFPPYDWLYGLGHHAYLDKEFLDDTQRNYAVRHFSTLHENNHVGGTLGMAAMTVRMGRGDVTQDWLNGLFERLRQGFGQNFNGKSVNSSQRDYMNYYAYFLYQAFQRYDFERLKPVY